VNIFFTTTAQAIADVFSKAWLDNATEKRITHRSEPWWNDTCMETLLQYQDDKTPENWSTFCKATRAAKRKFFDAKIEEIAKTNRCPWDLMEWVKERKLPPCKAIQYNGQWCHIMSECGMHSTTHTTLQWIVLAICLFLTNSWTCWPRSGHLF